MARYKEYSYEQTKLIPIAFSQQILPGTFEYTLNYLIDNEVELSPFEQRYHNDETGAPADQHTHWFGGRERTSRKLHTPAANYSKDAIVLEVKESPR